MTSQAPPSPLWPLRTLLHPCRSAAGSLIPCAATILRIALSTCFSTSRNLCSLLASSVSPRKISWLLPNPPGEVRWNGPGCCRRAFACIRRPLPVQTVPAPASSDRSLSTSARLRRSSSSASWRFRASFSLAASSLLDDDEPTPTPAPAPAPALPALTARPSLRRSALAASCALSPAISSLYPRTLGVSSITVPLARGRAGMDMNRSASLSARSEASSSSGVVGDVLTAASIGGGGHGKVGGASGQERPEYPRQRSVLPPVRRRAHRGRRVVVGPGGIPQVGSRRGRGGGLNDGSQGGEIVVGVGRVGREGIHEHGDPRCGRSRP
mmetsp:Transcript_60642/g.179818  ORF Transcript_60642/g.179818 Transcript_60642/m.179818 type:complete len:325 (+) Transcript_60642:403-1377(+)